MKVFIAGITGATGQLLTSQLLEQGHEVVGYVRNLESLPKLISEHAKLSVKQGSLLDVSDDDLHDMLADVNAIVSCLGHNLSREGIWGHPRTLVRDAVQRLTSLAPEHNIRFVLMGSNGVANKTKHERFPWADQMVVNLLRQVLPPHRDNEMAAEFLQTSLHRKNIEWSIVRPDNLQDAPTVTEWEAFEERQRGVIFKAGFTSRVNVANFMLQLVTDSQTWQTWAGKWPVVYNAEALQQSA